MFHQSLNIKLAENKSITTYYLQPPSSPNSTKFYKIYVLLPRTTYTHLGPLEDHVY